PARLLDLFSSSLSMVNNVGPGFGVLGARQNYGCLTEITKLVYSFAMFSGRLDLYLPLLICSPTFWKR
ncbi:MAG: TrkH family potassium uptake protein, partial [Thermoguttaceae bacterium]|nr:TrkH family potassium uptake protein [Thermoguttaceae bacterium]